MSEAPPSVEPPPADAFAEQARATGLTLPSPKKTNPWDAVAVTAVIVLASLGIGAATGWLNLRVATTSPPGLLGPQSCIQGGGHAVDLRASVATDADPLLGGSLEMLSTRFAVSYGPCLHFNYTTSPGGDGLQSTAQKSVDLAMVEIDPTSVQLAQLPNPAVVAPLGLTGIAVIYNLPGVTDGLRLSGSVLEGIYSGAITSWGDPAIERLNPGVQLASNTSIAVIYRSDPTVLNAMFTGFLGDANSSWATQVGTGPQVPWPDGTGVTSNQSMVTLVAQTPGAVGYVEIGTGLPSGLGTATIQNPAGNFTAPNPESLAAAAAAVANTTASTGANWTGVSLLNAPGGQSYPLALLSYVVLYQDLGLAFGQTLGFPVAQWALTFLWWAVTSGGYLTGPLGFVPLPGAVVAVSQQVLTKVAFNGASILEGSEGSENGGETGEF
jgi:phosphate transport system substrate-binding protein